MNPKQKFWAVAFAIILIMWVLVSDPAKQPVQYPEGRTIANQPKPVTTPKNIDSSTNLHELPSPMYPEEAMQQLIDSGAIHALKGVKLGEEITMVETATTKLPANQQPASFRTQTIRFNTKRGVLPLVAGMADTEELQSRGMMYHRRWPAQMHGLLFIMKDEFLFNMWMKNTYLSLDMIFMNAAGEVVNIVEKTQTLSPTLISCGKPSQYVLEVPAGSAQKWQIALGDRLLLPLAAK